ncbi:MAG: ROK family protein [Clostridia bacterium]|nr:ROK family protein [Clostridia bacterium]
MYTIGIDLGGTNIAIGICDENLNIVAKGSVPTNADRAGEEIIKDMAALAKRLLDEKGISLSEVEYAGIASPGSIDTDAGVVIFAGNLPFKNFPIAELFKKYLPVKAVYIANDANAAALGEALAGSAKGADSCVMVTLGTGVGGGIIINGKIFAGGLNSSGAEIGHVILVHGGRQCTCGRRGCWEAYSSATALTEMTKEKMTELSIKNIPSLLFKYSELEGKVSARTAFSAMKEGDPYGKELVDSYISYLADGITDMINIFQPEVLIIGGGVCNERENLTVPLGKLVEEDQFTRTNAVKTRIVIATLGNDAGIIGAAGLGR